MPDREKVIHAVKTAFDVWIDEYTGCSWFEEDEVRRAKEDAIALLKEQEAVEPEVEVLNEIDRLYRCPRCHKHFFYEKQKYCDQCGQAVKWE